MNTATQALLQTGAGPDVFIGVLRQATAPIRVSYLVSALAQSGHSNAVPTLQAVLKDSTLAGKFRDQYPALAEQARAALDRIQTGAVQ